MCLVPRVMPDPWASLPQGLQIALDAALQLSPTNTNTSTTATTGVNGDNKVTTTTTNTKVVHVGGASNQFSGTPPAEPNSSVASSSPEPVASAKAVWQVRL